ncbi:hypothetical protein [Streptomyces sp. NPDC050428]|uniref:hypothetical protein n=1 Tax=Streptomyces sp. NPDC050428 TaxID=3155757 RepID=UPI00344255B1
MADERLQWAFRVVPGDHVTLDGIRREVTGSRVERYATGGLAVVLAFRAGSPVRVPATSLVTVIPPERQPAEPPPAEVNRDGPPVRGVVRATGRLLAAWARRLTGTADGGHA